MNTRRIAAAAFAAALLAGALAACSEEKTAVSWAHAYPTLKSLVAGSDAIVKGTIVGIDETVVVDKIPYTDSHFKVEKWIKGAGMPGDVITIRQTGGTVNGKKTSIEDDPLFVNGESGLMYLMKSPDQPVYATLSGPSGRLEIQNGKVAKMKGTSLKEDVPSDPDQLISETNSLMQ